MRLRRRVLLAGRRSAKRVRRIAERPVDRPVTAQPVGVPVDRHDPDLGAFRRFPTCKE